MSRLRATMLYTFPIPASLMCCTCYLSNPFDEITAIILGEVYKWAKISVNYLWFLRRTSSELQMLSLALYSLFTMLCTSTNTATVKCFCKF